MKKTLLSIASATALLGALAAPAYAASTFHLVVPLGARTQVQEPVEAITVSLAGAALPKATVNKAYSESLRSYLSVTGDVAFEPAAARWSLAEGALPAGLSLDETTGAVAGTPMAKTTGPSSFTVLAAYKGSDGRAVYTLEVGGQVIQVSKIAAGQYHTCAVTTAGGVKCWGKNTNGQLGDGSTANQITPVDVVGIGSGVIDVSAGVGHTCVLMDSGGVKCWGSNGYGQLGDGSTTDSVTPVEVAGLSAVASLELGGYHSCSLTVSGIVKCWGNGGNGRLGNNSTGNKTTPVDALGLGTGVKSISAGDKHTCATTATGAAMCWGSNSHGQLGDNSTNSRLIPVTVTGLSTGVSRVASGLNSSCALLESGYVKCWGDNAYGQLGDGSINQRLTPVDVVGLESDVSQLTAGGLHNCAVTSSGAVKCWGYNGSGQLGNNISTSMSKVAVDVFELNSGVMHMTAGSDHTCAVITSGVAKCWGANSQGQLGNNSTTYRRAPVDVQGFQ